MAAQKQHPRIVRSDLTSPPKWFVITRYRIKHGVGADGSRGRFLVPSEKFDVTDQMISILKSESR